MQNKNYIEKITINDEVYNFSFRPLVFKNYKQLSGKDILEWIPVFKDIYFTLIKSMAGGEIESIEFDDAIYDLVKPGSESYFQLFYSMMADADENIGTYDEWFESLTAFPLIDFVIILFPKIAESTMSKKGFINLVSEAIQMMTAVYKED